MAAKTFADSFNVFFLSEQNLGRSVSWRQENMFVTVKTEGASLGNVFVTIYPPKHTHQLLVLCEILALELSLAPKIRVHYSFTV